ncbi:MAG: hypothetical protein D6680_06720 [Cyanobacteria bacterium J007]|nr:MAG: hypothetical protein D6680_06720 [Cyanobacteria bacterium J007]
MFSRREARTVLAANRKKSRGKRSGSNFAIGRDKIAKSQSAKLLFQLIKTPVKIEKIINLTFF